jgi:nucleotide-binding universal stress UspA family protein
MEENKKLIVVPWDFSPVAGHALAHAVKISRMVSNDICLLHIVDEGASPKELNEKVIKLKRLVDENSVKYGMPISYQISKGSIFTAIAEYANEKDANLVVMGTHGMKGMQKLTGSWALKVIVKSKVPFIVVQEPPTDQERYHNIVFPIDFRNENKEKMSFALGRENYKLLAIGFVIIVVYRFPYPSNRYDIVAHTMGCRQNAFHKICQKLHF